MCLNMVSVFPDCQVQHGRDRNCLHSLCLAVFYSSSDSFLMASCTPYHIQTHSIIVLDAGTSNLSPLPGDRTLAALVGGYCPSNVLEYGVLKLAVVKSTRIACQHMGLIAPAGPIHIFLHFVFSVYLLALPYSNTLQKRPSVRTHTV